MNSDRITTIIGAIGAAVTAVQPALSAANGSLDGQDYASLALAAILGALGYFSNKHPA